jgi:hypothetical protein
MTNQIDNPRAKTRTPQRQDGTAEVITAKAHDWWMCLCGNEADQEGFFPCDRMGHQVEPTAQEWPEPLYVCDRCGRIIEHGTRRVVGRRSRGSA